MIYLYSGTPGSGKSLHVAQDIYWRLVRRLPVVCNFEINTECFGQKRIGAFRYLDNSEMTPDKLIKLSRSYFRKHKFKEDRILLVIDECQLLFNCREWSAEGRKDWMSFFTQHRKFGYMIILVAQFDRMLDRQIRSLIEYNVIHRKASNFGIGGKILSILAMGNLFVAVKIWYPIKTRISSETFKAHKRYYQLYDSYKHFEEEPKEEKSNVVQMRRA